MHNNPQAENVVKPQILSMGDITNIISLKFIDFGNFKAYDPIDRSLTFLLSEGYIVKVKSCDEITYEKQSYFHRLPGNIIQDNLFVYFSAYELFKLRGVNRGK